jgi:hypothetical protein
VPCADVSCADAIPRERCPRKEEEEEEDESETQISFVFPAHNDKLNRILLPAVGAPVSHV